MRIFLLCIATLCFALYAHFFMTCVAALATWQLRILWLCEQAL